MKTNKNKARKMEMAEDFLGGSFSTGLVGFGGEEREGEVDTKFSVQRAGG